MVGEKAKARCFLAAHLSGVNYRFLDPRDESIDICHWSHWYINIRYRDDVFAIRGVVSPNIALKVVLFCNNGSTLLCKSCIAFNNI